MNKRRFAVFAGPRVEGTVCEKVIKIDLDDPRRLDVSDATRYHDVTTSRTCEPGSTWDATAGRWRRAETPLAFAQEQGVEQDGQYLIDAPEVRRKLSLVWQAWVDGDTTVLPTSFELLRPRAGSVTISTEADLRTLVRKFARKAAAA